jgi:hypothetical protein
MHLTVWQWAVTPYVMLCFFSPLFHMLCQKCLFTHVLLFAYQVAAVKGISQVVFSRIVMCAPGMSKSKCATCLSSTSFCNVTLLTHLNFCDTFFNKFPVWWPGLKNSPTVTRACRKRWLGTQCLGYSWATLSLEVINVETWSSRLGVGRWTNNSAP